MWQCVIKMRVQEYWLNTNKYMYSQPHYHVKHTLQSLAHSIEPQTIIQPTPFSCTAYSVQPTPRYLVLHTLHIQTYFLYCIHCTTNHIMLYCLYCADLCSCVSDELSIAVHFMSGVCVPLRIYISENRITKDWNY